MRVTGGSGKVPGRFQGFQAVPGGFRVLQTTQSAQRSFVFRSFTPREFTVSSLGKGFVIRFSQRQGVNGSANAAATRYSPGYPTYLVCSSCKKYYGNLTKTHLSASWLVRADLQNRDTRVPTEVESLFRQDCSDFT